MMKRTANRPVASGRVSPQAAIVYGCLLACASFALLSLAVNPLAAVLAMSGFLGYVLVYTLWLKRTTPQNIVIGGAAGAVPPLVGWAAATGGLDGTALYLFAIVFYWTPPHFWALSLLMKDDYAKAGVPMLPVVRGEDETRRQIVLYTLPPLRRHPAAVLRRRVRRDLPGRLDHAGRRVHRGRPLPPAPAEPDARPCASTSTRWPTSRCCSARWCWTRSSRSARR